MTSSSGHVIALDQSGARKSTKLAECTTLAHPAIKEMSCISYKHGKFSFLLTGLPDLSGWQILHQVDI